MQRTLLIDKFKKFCIPNVPLLFKEKSSRQQRWQSSGLGGSVKQELVPEIDTSDMGAGVRNIPQKKSIITFLF